VLEIRDRVYQKLPFFITVTANLPRFRCTAADQECRNMKKLVAKPTTGPSGGEGCEETCR
jgi:hypothetical protein